MEQHPCTMWHEPFFHEISNYLMVPYQTMVKTASNEILGAFTYTVAYCEYHVIWQVNVKFCNYF